MRSDLRTPGAVEADAHETFTPVPAFRTAARGRGLLRSRPRPVRRQGDSKREAAARNDVRTTNFSQDGTTDLVELAVPDQRGDASGAVQALSYALIIMSVLPFTGQLTTPSASLTTEFITQTALSPFG